MIQPWNNVNVVNGGETIVFVIQENDTDRSPYAHASPLPNCFIIVVKKNFDLPANFHSDGARTEFHDMCILGAIASKLYPTDSARASLAVQQMRFTMQWESGTSNVIVNL